MNKENLMNFLENDLLEFNKILNKMDSNSFEYEQQLGEIQYIEYLLEAIKEGKIS